MMAEVTPARRRNKKVRTRAGVNGLRQELVKEDVLDKKWKIFKKKAWNMTHFVSMTSIALSKLDILFHFSYARAEKRQVSIIDLEKRNQTAIIHSYQRNQRCQSPKEGGHYG